MEMADRVQRALVLMQEAYKEQMEGDYTRAAELYQASIEQHPTAEAHTFLGWTYGSEERYEEAIAECRKAIQVDPEFGNPYNDIGSYLIQMGKFAEAVPWLEQAKNAPRYQPRHFPYLNLARVYMAQGNTEEALREMEQARFIEDGIEAEDQEDLELDAEVLH
jgi:Tfp pilus assembly protein PilF